MVEGEEIVGKHEREPTEAEQHTGIDIDALDLACTLAPELEHEVTP